jgi:hypothetical protein
MSGQEQEEPRNKTPDQQVSREPATPEEERALEQEELESFRRRKEWSDRVLGGDGDASGEPDDGGD